MMRAKVPICLLAAFAQVTAAVEVELHGSGTTNPSKFFWKTMEILQSRTKEELRMSYRAVGSSTGQKEFVGQASNSYKAYNDFGAGDIPMSSSRFASLSSSSPARQMVHVPFSLGAIAIFHSVPAAEVGAAGLKLSPCVLAKIFSGQITTWDHAEILSDNPSLDVPPGTKIQVGHRRLGSSSTGGVSGYLDKKCPSSWTLGASSSISWPSAATFHEVEGSPGMTAHIADKKYSIGYLDAGHGHKRNFGEVKMLNKAGTWLTSTEALAAKDTDGNNGVSAAGAAAASTYDWSDVTSDWSAINLYDQDGTNTWPIVLVSYMYISKDISSFSANKAGLLKAFVDMVTGTEGQAMLAEFSFQPIPGAMNKWANTWNLLTKPASVTEYTFESSTDPWNGQGSFVISKKRNSYTMWQTNELQIAVDALTERVHALEEHITDFGLVPLHGSGTTNPKNLFAKTMKQMEHRARAPLFLTYRAVGSSTGQKEFVGQASNGYMSYNHFGAGDIPMSQSRYNQLPAGQEMLHVPFALGAIGIFHNVPGAGTINFNACLLAKIYMGQIDTWDHSEIMAANPGLSVPSGQKIIIGHRRLGSSSTGGTSGYLNKKCPEVWTKGESGTIDWPKQSNFKQVEGSPGMAGLLQKTQYSIGYLDAGHGHDLGFSEIALTNAAGKTRTSKEAIALGGVADAGNEGVKNGAFPSNPSQDWSAVNVYDQAGENTWPIVLVSYFYIKKDQSNVSPKTAAALRAFVRSVLLNEESLLEEFGFTAPSTSLRSASLTTVDAVVWPRGMENFVFESSTDPWIGMGANVISKKRHSYDDYHRGLLEDRITKLEAAIGAGTGAGASTGTTSGSGSGSDDDDGDSDPLGVVALIVAIVAAVLACSATGLVLSRGKPESAKLNQPGQAVGNPAI
eukprot:gnl/TRDRNA2_/TRDRNA2_147641_c0_seq1.p1 gnl/TRDRNA2_/TRDRNA2_147641_c0~~gnl/TRDRNA2_/TRDRNA2_147641_c0_seq1.p1  ORF type:complete len:904 (+),score=158.83 gnl/TRDRNA2_/TRDRNA2_147641_c0_seq1:98-2809(+)